MRNLVLGITGMLVLLVLVSNVQAAVGFGMTDLQSEAVMSPNMDKVCITYYLYNPGDVTIEGYLDVDREGGKALNKLLGLDGLYSQLDELEEKQRIINEEYESVASQGQSTFEVEKKQQEIGAKISEINKQVQEKKPTEKILIPGHTPAKNEAGNYQLPISICFERPTKTYLFQQIGDTEYCGRYEGEIVGRYVPKADETTGATGSAILGSRSTVLKLKVECDVNEKTKALWIFVGTILSVLFIIIFIIWRVIQGKKKKWKQQNQYTQTS